MMGGTVVLERALRSSVFLLMDRRRELEKCILVLEKKMATVRTAAESATLEQQMAAHRAAIAEIEAQQEAEREAARQAAAAAAAAAKRAALTGHAAELAEAHAAKLQALDEAEQYMMAAVAAINRALAAEREERAAVGAMAQEMNVETRPLQFSEHETVGRLVGGICSYLARISACRMRRLGGILVLPDDPRTRGTDESWRSREARATAESVRLLIEHAQTQQSQH